MVSTSTSALGIIFPNAYDDLMPEMVALRTMASIPFAGRYRLIDFPLSSMSHSGIDNVSIIVKKNYHSLLDHLGSGREWDMSRKRGGLNIIPPYSGAGVKVYTDRIEALSNILGYLERQRERYVVLSDSNMAINFDYGALLDAHVAKNADVTMVYQRREIPTGLHDQNCTLRLDKDGRVTEVLTNGFRSGEQNLGLNIYVMEREALIQMVRDARSRGMGDFVRNIVGRNLQLLNVQGYAYDGYVAIISDIKSYFDENMKLLDTQNLDALFPDKTPIYTKIRDDAPTRYAMDSKAINCVMADGCCIEGEVENCVLFRGVQIKKGAHARNCVLMQDTVLEPGADIEYVITDKNVRVTEGKKLSGDSNFPIYVAKSHTV